MGSANVLMHHLFIERLQREFPDKIAIVSQTEYGEGLWSVLVQTPLLPVGYQGCMELAVVNGELKFKREADT